MFRTKGWLRNINPWLRRSVIRLLRDASKMLVTRAHLPWLFLTLSCCHDVSVSDFVSLRFQGSICYACARVWRLWKTFRSTNGQLLPLRSSSWVACACHSRWQSLVGMAKTAKFASQGHRKSSCQKGRWMADFSLSSFQFSLIWMYPRGQKPTSADHLVQGSFTRLIDIKIELLCLGSTWFNHQDKICEQDWARFTKCKDLKSEARFLLSNRPTRQGQQCLRPKDLDTSPGWAGVGRNRWRQFM